MKELDDVLAALEASGGRGVAVATVVAARGSTYRREGARLVVSADGDEVVGNISGGCLEGDVIATAREVLESGRPQLLRFDLTADDEAVWGWGLGCNGAIEVLIEPGEQAARYAPLMAAARREQRALVVATVIEGEHVGARLVVHEDGHHEGSLGSRDVDAAIRGPALVALARRRSLAVRIGPDVRAFLEVVVPAPRLVVCGAGHDAVPLVELASRLGWLVEVVDDRPALLSSERFPGAHRLVRSTPLRAADAVATDESTFVVVMSHNFLRDKDYLRAFLPAPVRYLGMLGPRARLERLLEDARREGALPGPGDLDKVYGPAGLDIGAEGPDEIAWAIISELLAVRNGSRAGFLRDRAGPVHLPEPVLEASS
jgi:xanthine/CO dehydrogenase XdhC/CoxF family maturation factor